MSDPVNSPPHYSSPGKLECIDYILERLGPLGTLFYCRGNSIKYQHRAGYKGKFLQDLKKNRWYVDKAIELTEKHRCIIDRCLEAIARIEEEENNEQ